MLYDSSLPCSTSAVGDAGVPGAGLDVERRLLVRVLAVAQRRLRSKRRSSRVGQQLAAGRRARSSALMAAVVGGGAGEGGRGQPLARRQRQRAVVGAQLVEDVAVLRRSR